MGGTDISLGRISSALAGAQHWEKNREIEKAAKRDGLGNAATALRAQYGFGDGMQQMQLESILKGDTRLARGTGTGEAETVAKDGKRTVYLNNYKDTMSADEQLAMGITLGHEAYRDGLVGSGQQQFMETARAVIGHTEMALRMQADQRYSERMGNIIAGSSILQKDIAAYKSGDMMTMIGHVAGNYDYSKDYWKLVVNKNGNTGWQEDGSLDFNIDITDPEVIKAFQGSPELMNRLLKSGVGKNGIVSIGHGEMNEDYARQVGAALNIQDPKRTLSIGVPGSMPRNRALESFIGGTRAFAKVSGIAENMRNGILSQNNIDELNGALLAAQNSGWVVKNKIKYATGLNGKGTDQMPYLPLTGEVTVTCQQGERFVTKEFYDQLKEDSRGNFPLYGFAKYSHLNTDLWSKNPDVVTSVNGSLQLKYDSVWGLSGTLNSATGDLAFRSNHLAKNSIMNYLAAFGMDGTAIKNDSGNFSLTGLKAGVVYGTMGNTGISGAPHVDFNISNSTNRSLSFSDLFKEKLYPYKQTPYAKNFSGLASRIWYENSTVKSYMLDVYRKEYGPLWELLQYTFF